LAYRITVTKSITISAAHWLPDHPLCGKLHGHNYKVEASYTGLSSDLLPDNDMMLLDFGIMKQHLEQVVGRWDHAGALNDEYDYPTAEWMAFTWLTELRTLHTGYTSVRVWETETASAEASVS
jgi:6-pyruvoyl tetrahydropterin synthase/QueD family protein